MLCLSSRDSIHYISHNVDVIGITRRVHTSMRGPLFKHDGLRTEFSRAIIINQ